MNKELYVSSTPHETRLALAEDGEIAELYYEREKEYSLAGAIYKGRVTRVLPGMQSAFVDIGLERDAFLYVSDFFEDGEEYDRVVSEAENAVAGLEKGLEKGVAPEPARSESRPAPPDRGEARAEAAGVSADSTAPSPEPVAAGDFGPPRPRDPRDGRDSRPPQSDHTDGGDRQRRGRHRGRRRSSSGFPDSKFAGPAESGSRDASRRDDDDASRRGDDASRRNDDAPRHDDSAPRETRGEQGSRDDRETRPRDERNVRPSEERDARSSQVRESPPSPASTPAAAYAAMILPGESLAKYRGRENQTVVAPPPPVESHSASHEPAPFEPAPFEEDEPLAAAAELELPAPPAAASEEAVAVGAEVQAEVQAEAEAHRESFEHDRMQPDSPRHAGVVPAEAAATAAVEAVEVTEIVIEAEVEMDAVESEDSEAAGDLDAVEMLEVSDDDEFDDDGNLIVKSNPEAGAASSNGDQGRAEVRQQPPAARMQAPSERGGRGRQRRRGRGRGGYQGDRPAGDRPAGDRHGSERPGGERQGNDRQGGERQGNDRQGSERSERQGNDRPRAPESAPARSASSEGGPRLIGDLLREGQEILIQISKEPLGKKGARITSHLALPGRFLVYMPTVHHIGVSRKIGSDEERARLKRFILEQTKDLPGGFIVRTAAAAATEEELAADIRLLANLWTDIRQQFEQKRSPALLHHDLDLVERVLRDQLSNDFSHIWVDTDEMYQRVVKFVSYFMPQLASRIRLYTREAPLFEHFGIDEEIDKALKSKVWLKSGGYIVLNQTEALVAIDVNTGKYVGKSNRLEDTIVKTNVDAIKEIVRQIRLRDLGGIIVIDFIDMDERRNRQKVMAALDEAMRADRAPSKVLSFNDFGLVALTRKRVKQSLERTLGGACPYCEGVGLVKSATTVCNEIYIEAKKVAATIEREDLVLRVNPEIAKALKAQNASRLRELEDLTRKAISVRSDPQVHQEQFEIY